MYFIFSVLGLSGLIWLFAALVLMRTGSAKEVAKAVAAALVLTALSICFSAVLVKLTFALSVTTALLLYICISAGSEELIKYFGFRKLLLENNDLLTVLALSILGGFTVAITELVLLGTIFAPSFYQIDSLKYELLFAGIVQSGLMLLVFSILNVKKNQLPRPVRTQKQAWLTVIALHICYDYFIAKADAWGLLFVCLLIAVIVFKRLNRLYSAFK